MNIGVCGVAILCALHSGVSPTTGTVEKSIAR
jgi:hypothetical protein